MLFLNYLYLMICRVDKLIIKLICFKVNDVGNYELISCYTDLFLIRKILLAEIHLNEMN
jgi:hypothetical protein